MLIEVKSSWWKVCYFSQKQQLLTAICFDIHVMWHFAPCGT